MHSYWVPLQALGCPYLQGMEESVVGKVVLTPGEARVRVMCWLVDKYVWVIIHENCKVFFTCVLVHVSERICKRMCMQVYLFCDDVTLLILARCTRLYNPWLHIWMYIRHYSAYDGSINTCNYVCIVHCTWTHHINCRFQTDLQVDYQNTSVSMDTGKVK